MGSNSKGIMISENIHWMGSETREEEKKMKKRFSKFSKAGQEKKEIEYHQMKPEDFDEQMSRAERHSPHIIRLPPQLVEALNTMAELTGEAEYQTLVRRWIEERLKQEAGIALRLSKMPIPKAVTVLKRQLTQELPN